MKTAEEILDNPKILMLSYGNYISLDDYVKLKDYITNLQERCEYLERSNNRREDDILYKRQEISDLEDKIYKAIEKILSLKNKLYSEPPLWLEELQDILEGSVK